ncbi:MAG: DEAD/DEAH box helicase [Chloroflexota bacterium]
MMTFILHGTFLPEIRTFTLWGEQAEPTPRKQGRQAKLTPPPHPFCVPAVQLADWVLTIATHLKPVKRTSQVIWLPSYANLPQPSPELAATGAILTPTSEALTLKQWKIEGVELSASDAIDFLLALEDRHSALMGEDMYFWRQLTLFALSLVSGQQVIPAFSKDGAQLRAIWKPQPTEIEHVTEWIGALPPLSRALVEQPEAAPAPGLVVNGWVEAVIDQTVRQAAGRFATKLLSKPTTPGGKWLRALIGEESLVPLKGAEADQLYKDWQTWVGQSDVAGNAAFRITFRLDAPDDPNNPDDSAWALHYLLQATDDPSLVVTAGQVWREKGKSLGYLHQRFDQPQERLLAALGFAARVFPPIEQSLHSATPDKAVLNTTQAYTFLKESALLLQNSGFRVLLPRWWGGKTARVTAKATVKTPKSASKSLLTMQSLINYEWQVMLGGEPLSREEFERLARLKQPLVQLRGQWVMLDEAQIAAGLKLFGQQDGQLRLDEALRLGLEREGVTAQGVLLAGFDATGWFKTLMNTLRQPDKIAILPLPEGLHAELRPYQVRGYSWLTFMRNYGLGACLADDMGLGKTVTSISAILYERQKLKVKQPVLIVCPTSVMGNWRRELERFAPTLKVLSHHGIERLTGAKFAKAAKTHDMVITSYPLLARDRSLFEAMEWSTIVLDEAQNIKNAATKQAQAARALRGSHRVALTGTPVENRLSELWSIFNFLNPGYLGSEAEFRKQFANPIERTNDKNAAKQLRQLTAPFILRRLKTDPTIISDLPEKLEMKVYCTLTTEQGTLYQAVVNEALEAIEQAEDEGNAMSRRGLVLSMLLKLKQICNHPAQFLKDGTTLEGRSGKLARLTEMLEEVYAAGDRALIFTQFAEMGVLLRDHIRHVYYDEPLWLYGGTPTKDRDAMIQRFQAPKGPSVFILSIKAGGVGLNLTRANHVFHFDRWWNPAVENQATDRAFRIGQTRNVQVHKFICGGTLEDKIDEMIESKKALAESVIGTDESWLTELSTDSLRDLVALRHAEIE